MQSGLAKSVTDKNFAVKLIAGAGEFKYSMLTLNASDLFARMHNAKAKVFVDYWVHFIFFYNKI